MQTYEQIKQHGKVLKQLRLARKLTQAQLCENICSRQMYGKIETNIAQPTLEQLNQFLNRLNIDFLDYFQLANEDTPLAIQKVNLKKAHQNQITDSELKQMSHYLHTNRFKDKAHFYQYLLATGHLHQKYPTIFPDLDEQDIQHISSYLKNLCNNKAIFTLTDLKLFGNSINYLDFETIKSIKKYLGTISIVNNPYLTNDYETMYHLIMHNITDKAITHKEFKLAKTYLNEQERLLNESPNYKFKIMFYTNKDTLEYLLTRNTQAIGHLYKVKEICNTLEDTMMINAIDYTIKQLLQLDTHKPAPIVWAT